jgi:dihydrofolate synthase / folylpolyglutamate synthase
MARSDAILTRLLQLHPKIIDLSLERMYRILDHLDHPERKLPRVIHVAGTNGKGSCIAYLRSIFEAAGLTTHCYTSPHLVRFHERIRVAGDLISEPALTTLLEECEIANGSEEITFFEITTAAAFLAFSRTPADYLILEVGLGGRLDATNVIENPIATCITSIGLDHQQFLGDTLSQIAAEKAGILKRGVPAIIGRMPVEARTTIEDIANDVKAPAQVADQDWQSFEQHGRFVFQDGDELLDLPMPNLVGSHQIQNAGNAVAIIRTLNDERISELDIAKGVTSADWPARMQRLRHGRLSSALPNGTELWLDGGHNTDAGVMLAEVFTAMKRQSPKPLTVIWGMLNTKDGASFMAPLVQVVDRVITLTIPGEPNAISADDLARTCRNIGLEAETAPSIETALQFAASSGRTPRILICGSLYLAGHVLAAEEGTEMSAVTGAARR